jgi:hypothetical protein
MEFLNYNKEYFRGGLTYGWIRCFFQRSVKLAQTTMISPNELPRLQIPHQYLNQYIELIRKYVPFVPVDLTDNLDKIGLSDWQDSKPKSVLVPTNLGDSIVHYPINHQIRH